MAGLKKSSAALSKRGRPPAGQSEDRNTRILDAATEVFLEAGFSGATMTAIAKRAGCSLETLYTAYSNKAEMFAALTTRRSAGLFEAVGPLRADRDLREALLRFATEVLALMMRPEVSELHRLVIGESRSFPELGETFWAEGPGQGSHILTRYFAAKHAEGACSIKNPARAAEVFMGLVLGVATMRSTLGLKTIGHSKRQQTAWTEYSVNLFVTLLEQGLL